MLYDQSQERGRQLLGLTPPAVLPAFNDRTARGAQVLGLAPTQRSVFHREEETALEMGVGYTYEEDPSSLRERLAEFGISVGKQFLRDLNVFEGGISAREKAFRVANVATYALPLGMLVRSARLVRAFPALRPMIASTRGRIALTALENGAVEGALELARPEEQRGSVFLSATLGAAAGGALQGVLERATRKGAQAVSGRFQDMASMADRGTSPLLDGTPYAVLQPGGAGGAANRITRLADLQSRLSDLGVDPVLVRMGKQDGLLIPGLREADALALATELGQPHVLTHRGLVNVQEGTFAPLRRSEVKFGPEIGPGDWTMTLRGADGPLEFAPKFAAPEPHVPMREGGKRALPRAVSPTLEASLGFNTASYLDRVYTKMVRAIHRAEQLDKLVGTSGSESLGALLEMGSTDWIAQAEHAIRYGMREMDDLGAPVTGSLHSVWDKVDIGEQEDFLTYARLKKLGDTLPPAERPLPNATFDAVLDETDQWMESYTREALKGTEMVSPDLLDDLLALRGTDAWEPIAKVLRDGAEPAESFFEETIQEVLNLSKVMTNLRAGRQLARTLDKLGPDARHFGSVKFTKLGEAELTVGGLSLTEKAAALKTTRPALLKKWVNEVAESIALARHGLKGTVGEGGTVAAGFGTRVEVTDELLWDAMKHLGPTDFGGQIGELLVKVGAPSARFLRAGAVFAPEFLAKNVPRDMAFAMVNAGLNPLNTVKGLASLLKKDDLYQRWLAPGGPHSALTSMDLSPRKEALKAAVNASAGRKAWNVVKSPLEMLAAVSEFSEHATRLGSFRQFLKQNAGRLPEHQLLREAALHSKQVTVNFSMHGSSAVPAVMRMMAAFWGAHMQSLDMLGKKVLREPGKIMTRGALGITLPSTILYLHNRKDPEYRELPDWEKLIFWHIKAPSGMPLMGDRWLRVPKPFELGIMFGTLPERFLAAIDEEDPSSLDNFAKAALGQTGRGLLPIPTAATPVLELFANKSLYTGAPVTSPGLENVEKKYRTKTGTSTVAETLSRTMLPFLSPIEIDHLMQGYGASLGRGAADITSYALESARAAMSGEPPNRRAADPLVGDLPLPARVVLSPLSRAYASRYPGSSSSVERLYAILDETRETQSTLRSLEKQLAFDDYFAELEQRMTSLGLGPAAEQAAQTLKELRGQRDAVLTSPDFDSREKREIMDQLNGQMTLVARGVVDLAKEMGLRF